jgi:Zn finger protein HypA/HybF involved in hydrogenase expression
MPKDVLRSDLTPAAKLVFAAIAAELYRRETVEMTQIEIGACCSLGERQVRRSLQVLVAKGFVEQRRLSAGRVFQCRLLHAEFGNEAQPRPQSSGASAETPAAVPAAPAMAVCAQCHLPRRRLQRSGMCPGCKADMDLAARVKEVRAELGPDATPERIAERMKQIAEDRGRRRLTARVRRAMETASVSVNSRSRVQPRRTEYQRESLALGCEPLRLNHHSGPHLGLLALFVRDIGSDPRGLPSREKTGQGWLPQLQSEAPSYPFRRSRNDPYIRILARRQSPAGGWKHWQQQPIRRMDRDKRRSADRTSRTPRLADMRSD